jgi:signal transduction histidine kinase
MISLTDSKATFLNLSVSMNNTGERWAYIGLIIFLLISGVLLVYALQEQRKKNRILQNGEQIRSDLFAKITHEFRTPLTIILGLSKQLREQKELSGNNTITYLTAIERQGRNLSELVNQLLDLANLRAADDSIEWKTGNIVSFVEMVAETYSLYADSRIWNYNSSVVKRKSKPILCRTILTRFLVTCSPTRSNTVNQVPK